MTKEQTAAAAEEKTPAGGAAAAGGEEKTPVKPAEKPKKESKAKLGKDSEKILEMIEKLSVMELAELVKALEEKFGVSAAAPVAAAAATAAPAAAPAEGAAAAGGEEKAQVNIELKTSGDKKIAVIKVIRGITPLGLKEAKELVDNPPKIIKENVPLKEAEEIKKKLEEAGATVELK